MRTSLSSLVLVFAALVTAVVCVAQLQTRSGSVAVAAGPNKFIRIEDGGVIDEENVRTARETLSHSTETPSWTNPGGFEHDAFIFARLIFQSEPGPFAGRGLGPKLGWWVDYPDADLNLSWRLQQLTSIRTDPNCRVVKLTDPGLHDYPLLYMEHGGYMRLSSEEVVRLRSYLNSGGVLFVNDFWGTQEWEGFAGQIERVFPGHSWVDLTMDHPIFHCVFNLQGPMHQLRVPTMQLWNQGFDAADPQSPPHRIHRGEGSLDMSIRVLRDEAQRILVLAIHNSDVSDGWERERESDVYFNRFSEKIAYPLGVNIIFHLMMH